MAEELMTHSKRLSTYKMYTIGWIAALHKELTAAEAMLDEPHEQPEDFVQNERDNNTYSWGRIGDHNIVIASLGGGSYGKVSAATTATCMATSFPHLRFGLLVGIGAGIPRLEQDIDIRLGDVVVSVPTGEHPGVVQYDLGKKKDNGRFERVGALNRPPEVLLSGINKLRGIQRLKGSKMPQILDEAIQLYPMLGKAKGKDPPFIYQGSQHDRLFESTSVHVETGHGEVRAHSLQPNEISRTIPQLIYYGLRLMLAWLWTIVCFLLTARKPLDPTLDIKHQETSLSQSCFNCDPKNEIHRETRQTFDPEIHYGNIASGDLVIKGGFVRDLITKSLGKSFLCFEMEAAGLMNNFPCLVIRGICDYADSHKNDRWQNYAALAAAAYAKELLGTIDARKVERADKMEKIMAEVSDTKQAVQSMNDDRLLEKMYAWLSAPDPSINYQTALSQRHIGTCDWFLHTNHYERWKMGYKSSLWIYGGPGCGKTILSSVIINDLKIFEDDNQHLLFFFFSFTDSKKQSLDGVVRSLINQLSRKSQAARSYMTSTFKSKHEQSSEQPSIAELCEIFDGMLQRSDDIWLVLDAIDECQLGSSFKNEGLLPWLKTLLESKHDNIRTLVTSRREYNIRIVLDGCITETICLQGDHVAGDIQTFIDETITKWDGLKIWQEYGGVQEQIRNYLTKNSDGMFRWVSCQLDALAPLQGCRDHEAVIATLESLPKSLDGIYARIIHQIPEALHEKAGRILQFLLYSETPLFVEEIVEIATFSPKAEMSKRRIDSLIKPDKEAISLYCSSLVECVDVIDKSSGISRQVLQLAHCSVRDFLLSDRLERSMSCMFQPQFASGSMAKLCLTYLLDIEHHQPLENIISSYPLARYAACFWTEFSKQADTSTILGHFKELIRREDCFKTYRQLLNLEYGKDFFKLPRWMRRTHGTIADEDLHFLSGSMLNHFARTGLVCAVMEVLQKDIDAIEANRGYLDTPLQAAAYIGCKEVVSILLRAGANPNAQGGRYGNVLQAAACSFEQEVVHMLLVAGANPNAQGGVYYNALEAAAFRGFPEAVRLLLGAGADPNGQDDAEHISHGGPLTWAAAFGHHETMRLLLSGGANPNSAGFTHGSPLRKAVEEDQRKSIQILLDAGADPLARRLGIVDFLDPKAQEHGMLDPLHTAIHRGNLEVLQILLEAGADPNTLIGRSRNSLSFAIARNNGEAVKVLLTYQADIDEYDALSTAVCYGHTDMIELLIRKGAKINKHALKMALAKRRRGPIDLLLENITLTHSIERCLSTALSETCLKRRRDLRLVQILLDAGAKADVAGDGGVTALYVAAAKGHESLLQLFLDKVYAARQGSKIRDSPIQDTLLNRCTDVTYLLSMKEAVAKRLLGKALARSSSPGSRDAAKLLSKTCQAYHKVLRKNASLDKALVSKLQGVKKGCDIQVKQLLDQGADPNVMVSGKPSLCYLVETKRVEDKDTLKKLVKLLLDYGADATKRGCPWLCALDLAVVYNRWELVGLIRDTGLVEKTSYYCSREEEVDRELRRLKEERVED